MKKHKKVLWGILSIITALLLAAAITFWRNYKGIYLQTILFQLTAPGNEFASGVISRLAFHTIQHLTGIFLAAAIYMKFCETRKLSPWKYLPYISVGMAACAVLCAVFSVKGINKTIYNRFHFSSIYEDYYVDPAQVALTIPEKKRNLIVVYLESMETTYADKDSGGASDINYIPNLTQLSKDNITFSNTEYPVGGGYSTNGTDFTLGGLLATTSGVTYNISSYTGVHTDTYVNHGDVEFYRNYDAIEFMPSIVALGDILSDSGYYNEFICGTTGRFAGRSSYYQSHHCDEVYDIERFSQDYPDEDTVNITGFLAYEDDVLYDAAKSEIEKAAEKNQPFHIDILTIETHFPGGYVCGQCEKQHMIEYGNVLSCADRKIAAFLDWCRQQIWYPDTTIVILGDHIYMGINEIADKADRDGYQRCFYNCFVNSCFDPDAVDVINRGFTSADMFPTMLASIGITAEGDRLGIGTNLAGNRPTITEERGYDWVNEQLGMNGKMYRTHFNIKVQ